MKRIQHQNRRRDASNPTEPHLKLAAAILVQAARDARQRKDPVLAAEAALWLRSEGGDVVEALGLPRDCVPRWVGELPAFSLIEGLLAIILEDGAAAD